MSDECNAGGPLDVATLDVLAQRANSHTLVEGWAFQPDAMSPRRLEVRLDDEHYPAAVDAARLDVRWYEGGDYTFHYLETRADGRWQCRWDRHPKPGEPTAHYHPPPNAESTVESTPLAATHHLGVLFDVLEWITDRVEGLHEE